MLSTPDGEVLIAHLKQGSLRVASGMPVQIGEPLGRVGNSGNTLEPHLHIHLEKRMNGVVGRAVPMVFDGEFLSVNDVVEGR